MGAVFSVFTGALFRGLAQLAFCDSALAGALVLAGLALVSPWGAAGAVAGAVFSTAVGYFGSVYSREEWEHGLAGLNGAIIGILWGGFIANGSFNLPLFLTVLSVCAALESVLRRALARVSLPALSMPAVATAGLTSWALAAPGTWFWAATPGFPFGEMGIVIAILCIIAAMVTKSALAAGWTVIFATIAYLAVWGQGLDTLAYIGLWAVTIPLACYAMQAVFFREFVAGVVGSTIAALSTAGIWILWMNSGAADIAPPLLTPFIFGVWLAIAAMRRLRHFPFFQTSFWRTAGAIHRANLAGGTTVALLGDGAAQHRLASTYLSGSQRVGQTQEYTLSDEQLRNSVRCRRVFWDVCSRLRQMAEGTEPSALHRAVADFERRGWLQTTISREVFGQLRETGARNIIELHGRIDRAACIDCGFSSDWPPGEIWKRCDLRCSRCSGVFKPATSLLSESFTSSVMQAVERSLADCGILLVLGELPKDARTGSILDRARAVETTVVFVTDGALSYALGPDDVVIAARSEDTLPGLAAVLDALSLLSGVYPGGGRYRWRWRLGHTEDM